MLRVVFLCTFSPFGMHVVIIYNNKDVVKREMLWYYIRCWIATKKQQTKNKGEKNEKEDIIYRKFKFVFY